MIDMLLSCVGMVLVQTVVTPVRRSANGESSLEMVSEAYDPHNKRHWRALLKSGKQLQKTLRKYVRHFLERHLEQRREWGFRQAMIHVGGLGDCDGPENESSVLRALKRTTAIVHEEAENLWEERRAQGRTFPGERRLTTAFAHHTNTVKAQPVEGNLGPFANKTSPQILDDAKDGKVDVLVTYRMGTTGFDCLFLKVCGRLLYRVLMSPGSLPC